MKAIYLDCFSGISGDMCLSALVDLGVPPNVLLETIEQMHIPVTLEINSVMKNSLRATSLFVKELEPQPRERSLKDMLSILDGGSLLPQIRSQVDSCLYRLAAAESTVHGTTLEEVHFHEVGGLDTLVDLAGTFAGLDYLGVERVYASPLPLGRGTMKTAHGIIPIPAPAALELLQGIPTYGIPHDVELVTPTGAALVTTLATCFGPPPKARWNKTGYGAGRQDMPWPNILRAWLGEVDGSKAKTVKEGSYDEDQVVVLESQLDDNNPEFLPHLRSRLEEAGALDLFFTPIVMKKGRPGIMITTISPQERMDTLLRILFQETTTIGVRWYSAGRFKLLRDQQEVKTPYGEVRVKIGYTNNHHGGRVIYNLAPEYEDCARAAREKGVSIKEVYRATLRAIDE